MHAVGKGQRLSALNVSTFKLGDGLKDVKDMFVADRRGDVDAMMTRSNNDPFYVINMWVMVGEGKQRCSGEREIALDDILSKTSLDDWLDYRRTHSAVWTFTLKSESDGTSQSVGP